MEKISDNCPDPHVDRRAAARGKEVSVPRETPAAHPGLPRRINRRRALTWLGLAAAGVVGGTAIGSMAACAPYEDVTSDKAGATGAVRMSYGTHDRQVGDLFLPRVASRRAAPLVVMIHGGGWSGFSRASSTGHMAADIAARGAAVWNIEYRGSAGGGGWPQTYDDVAAAVDFIPQLVEKAPVHLDPKRVTVTGVSAGGNLAAWAASRVAFPPGLPGAQPAFPIRKCVAICGVYDMARAFRAGDKHIVPLLGGSPETFPDRYRNSSPISYIPADVAMSVFHGRNDAVVSVEQAQSYAAAAKRAGRPLTLRLFDDAGHGSWGEIAGNPWKAARKEILAQVGLRG